MARPLSGWRLIVARLLPWYDDEEQDRKTRRADALLNQARDVTVIAEYRRASRQVRRGR